MRGMLFEKLGRSALGRSVRVNALAQESIIRVYGDDKDAEMLTAVLSYEEQFTSLVSVVDMSAILRWGIGGQQNSAEVDLLKGTVISVPASYLEVIANNKGFQPTVVSASVGYGSRGTSALPTAF